MSTTSKRSFKEILSSTFRGDAMTSTGLMKDNKGQMVKFIRGITPTEFVRI